MSYSKVITTKQGERYLQDLIISEKPLTFTKIVTSTRQYEKEDLKSLTHLENIKQTISINKQEKFQGDSVEVQGTLSNKDIDGAYHIQTIGIYIQGDEIIPEPIHETDEEGELVLDENGEPIEVEPEPVYELDEEGNFVLDEDGEPIEVIRQKEYEEIIHGVAIAEEPFYMAPPMSNQISLTLKLNIFVGEANEINILPDPMDYLTHSNLEDFNNKLDIIEKDMSIATALAIEDLIYVTTDLNREQSIMQAKTNSEMLNIVMTFLGMPGVS